MNKGSDRIGWDDYFKNIVKDVATRSTCIRRQVGALIVKDNRMLASGYNGPPSGIKHCIELGGCYREINNIPMGTRHETCRAVHAEANAILQAAKYGQAIDDSTIYITLSPCSMCSRLIINAGIKEVKFVEGYPDKESLELLDEANIKYFQI